MCPRMLFFLVGVMLVVVLWSTDACRGRRIFPHVAWVKVIDPIFDGTRRAYNDLSHGAFIWSYGVTAWIGVQQVVHEVAGQAALLYREQRKTNSLLDFEDESLSRLCPRMVLLRGVLPGGPWETETRPHTVDKSLVPAV